MDQLICCSPGHFRLLETCTCGLAWRGKLDPTASIEREANLLAGLYGHALFFLAVSSFPRGRLLTAYPQALPCP
jgi:hypothetical protein